MRAGTGLATAAAIVLAGCQTMSSIAGSDEPPKSPEPSAAHSASSTAPVGAGAPASLAGMTADNLRTLWGEPTLMRREGEAQLWQYGGSGGCTLLIYLYPGAAALTVTHAEALPGGADDAAIEACAKASGKPSVKPVS